MKSFHEFDLHMYVYTHVQYNKVFLYMQSLATIIANNIACYVATYIIASYVATSYVH